MPELIDSVYASANSSSILPDTNFPLSIFGLTLRKIFSLSTPTYWMNSGRISQSAIDYNCYKCFSVSTGLTIVKQSRSLKTCFINLRILFFYSMLSELPFCCIRAFSRYYFGEITLSPESVSLKAKSLTTQRKLGKSF